MQQIEDLVIEEGLKLLSRCLDALREVATLLYLNQLLKLFQCISYFLRCALPLEFSEESITIFNVL